VHVVEAALPGALQQVAKRCPVLEREGKGRRKPGGDWDCVDADARA